MTQSRKVLILSQSYEPITITNWRKAFLLVFTGKAEVVEAYDDFLHSINSKFEMPSIIRLKDKPRLNRYKRVELNRKNVLKRDNHKCQYCGSEENLTIDHIIPKSRGGDTTWENLVTACHSCNNKKDNKYLNEVNMRLLSVPKKPYHVHFLIKKNPIQESWKPYLFLH